MTDQKAANEIQRIRDAQRPISKAKNDDTIAQLIMDVAHLAVKVERLRVEMAQISGRAR